MTHNNNPFLAVWCSVASPLKIKRVLSGSLLLLMMLSPLFVSCAKMGSPDGGWYDETPPYVVSASPADKGINVTAKKVDILFNEFIKLENASENVSISPPQLEQPEIKAAGKHILVQLKDSLKANTTYTIDFSDAISDNNEGNPLGNFTYSFSTGDHIDTLEVSGNVVEAQNLEPVKGIHVGLYPAGSSDGSGVWADSIFRTQPLLRVAQTDSRGHFVIKGIAEGSYRIFALKDADNNYQYTQKSEQIAFNEDIIVPSWKPDVRKDTIWADSLHIRDIKNVNYTHFLPDDIVLRAFSELLTDRYFLKAERKQANHFDVYFSYGHDSLPVIKGLNFDEKDAFIIESNEKKDSIIYWLRDSALINQDTLSVEMTYFATDSVGTLLPQTDTLEILSKEPYAKRLKKREDAFKDWKKKMEKAAKKGEPVDSIMPIEPLKAKWNAPANMSPDENVTVTFEMPILKPDTAAIHLYTKIDTTWYEAPFEFEEKAGKPRTYELRAEWKPEGEYSLEADSAAFVNIYGEATAAFKQGLKVKAMNKFSTLFFTFEGLSGKNLVASLIDKSDKVIKQVSTNNGTAQFFFIVPGTYYLKVLVDQNGNGIWDTGNYDEQLQPEAVYYYPQEIECKEKWDVTLSWNPLNTPLLQQKPGPLIKQKDEKKKKTIKNRNEERAKQMGIEYIKGVTGL